MSTLAPSVLPYTYKIQSYTLPAVFSEPGPQVLLIFHISELTFILFSYVNPKTLQV